MDVNKIILIGFGFLVALAIPIYFIVGRFLNLKETETWLSQLAAQRTSTAVPATEQAPTPTKTPIPTETATPTATPTSTPTPTEILLPDTGDNKLDAYLDQVIHLDENGPQTMVKIVAAQPLEGTFRAEIEIQWNSWKYYCFTLGDDADHLFCLGGRLPQTTQAAIKVFELLEDGVEELVFEANFEVPAVFPTNTPPPRKNTPKPGPTNTPVNTSVPPTSTPFPTPIPTNTPVPPTSTPLPTPIPTNTPVPTNTPTPTKGPPPTPWG